MSIAFQYVSVRKSLKGWSKAKGEPQARATEKERQAGVQSYEPTDRNSIQGQVSG